MKKEIENSKLFEDIVKIIEHARGSVASAVNSGITLMYWHIGKAINDDVLNGKRAEYGKQVVENLSVQLQRKYGTKEFSARSLRRMMQFSQEIDFQIVSPLVTKLSWTHFLLVLPHLQQFILEMGKGFAFVELLQLDESGIKVCQYMTELPDKQILIDELRKQCEFLENMKIDN